MARGCSRGLKEARGRRDAPGRGLAFTLCVRYGGCVQSRLSEKSRPFNGNSSPIGTSRGMWRVLGVAVFAKYAKRLLARRAIDCGQPPARNGLPPISIGAPVLQSIF